MIARVFFFLLIFGEYSSHLYSQTPESTSRGKYQYVDKETGKIVFPGEFNDAKYFSEGTAWVQNEMLLWGLIDTTGRLITEYIYEEYQYKASDNGLSYVKSNGKYGFIEKKTGKVIVPAKYDYVSEFYDQLAVVTKNELSGYINASGKLIISMIYRNAQIFSEGLAAVVVNGRYGFIDTKGKMVIKPQFSAYRTPFEDGLAGVDKRFGKKEVMGYVNKKGVFVDLNGMLVKPDGTSDKVLKMWQP